MKQTAIVFAIIGVVVCGALETLATPPLRQRVGAAKLLWPFGLTDSRWRRVLFVLAPLLSAVAGGFAGSRLSPGWAVALGAICLGVEQLAAVFLRLGAIAGAELEDAVRRRKDERRAHSR